MRPSFLRQLRCFSQKRCVICVPVHREFRKHTHSSGFSMVRFCCHKQCSLLNRTVLCSAVPCVLGTVAFIWAQARALLCPVTENVHTVKMAARSSSYASYHLCLLWQWECISAWFTMLGKPRASVVSPDMHGYSRDGSQYSTMKPHQGSLSCYYNSHRHSLILKHTFRKKKKLLVVLNLPFSFRCQLFNHLELVRNKLAFLEKKNGWILN